MTLPEDIEGNPNVEVIKIEENLYNFPIVVKDFLKKLPNDGDFNTLLGPVCSYLSYNEEMAMNDNSLSEIKNYFLEKKIIALEPYILPQKSLEGAFESTTKCIIHLRYGTVFQMKVEYFTIEELQLQLFVLVSPISDDLPFDSLLERFKVLTNYTGSEDDDKILQNAQQTFHSPEQIILSEDVQKFAGLTELYIGRGKNITEDRLALQSILRKLTTAQDSNEDEISYQRKKVAAVKKIIVYLPSKILDGGKEILEMPGTDESDPLAMDFIQKALNEADVTLLMTEFSFKTVEKEVKEVILNSHFRKYWQRDQEKFKLMLLTYPEKTDTWKFGINDRKNILKLETEATKKRKEEIKRFNNMLKDKYPLTTEMEDSIYTSYILPVLYTSIHAQEQEPHEILGKYCDFVKHSGINDLILTLNEFVARKHKAVIQEVKNLLQNLENTTGNILTSDDARRVMQLYEKKEVKVLYGEQCIHQNEANLIHLKKELEKRIQEAIDNEVTPLLSDTIQKAKDRWKEAEGRVTKVGIFNPYYCGKNSFFPVKLYDVMFNGLDEVKSTIFKSLLKKLNEALDDYKEKTIDFFTDLLTNLLGENKYMKQFVENAVKQALEDALSWYIGKKRMPFSERNLEKYFDTSLKDSLKKNMLKPAFKDSTETAKLKVTQSIESTIMKVSDIFKDYLLNSIHPKRWPPNFTRNLIRACRPPSTSVVLAPGCHFCEKRKCTTCPFINVSSTFKSRTNVTYEIKEVLTCISKSVIYLITCGKCGLQYVGQTQQCMFERFTDHKSRINCKKDLPVSQHFNQSDHSLEDIKLTIIESVSKIDDLNKRETYWINELQTLHPHGLNHTISKA
ncbi:uncharacterized protein LOC115461429 [Microcaecilia unicolor]|uniref:Uncharacterized protein LOC115461429 n=1 Tax=Microcaecilia unicolor TaxID=1415580 RepID=A0A6P7XAD2_9AMPH|nr:uncharacterized protein LOC115461429 [Microcaecilia unicolor]